MSLPVLRRLSGGGPIARRYVIEETSWDAPDGQPCPRLLVWAPGGVVIAHDCRSAEEEQFIRDAVAALNKERAL